MLVVTLPDGATKSFDQPVTVLQVAQSIGAGLARAALGGCVNGRLVDTATEITSDASLSIITVRDAQGLEIIRHSTAHLLAQAVKALFPAAQVTIGPVIEDGFFYDFSFERPFTPDDLERIERHMLALASADQVVTRRLLARSAAVDYFRGLGEHYKAEIIESIPSQEDISLYSQGDFTDLCRGPHVPSTGHLRAFKLMKIAGAYWRGDSRNEMLQRIYGTAWPDQKALAAYLLRLQEAEKRDHRRLGRQLDLFHFQEEAPGMAFWHPRGWIVWQQIERYLRALLERKGYQEVRCPLILDANLWRQSGHWENFHESMFTTESESREYAVKPMNCPGHVQIYNQGIKSYRDLPLRLAEFGACHRNEPSGALHGLMRVRAFTQDDGHIFCTAEQIQAEVTSFIDLLQEVYRDFGFEDLQIKLSTRPAKRVGSEQTWDKAESALRQALDGRGVAWELQPGEGAFYGPKVEFSLRDSIGRVWQCGTIQLDFSMPERLGAQYVAHDNSRRTPVMLHRAILGSLERFIGILIEHYSGYLPVWLAPCQAVVLNISERQATYATEVAEILQNQGFRVASDLRNEKIGLKIRDHTLQRAPFLLVVGDREAENNTVAVRTRRGEDLGAMSLEAFTRTLAEQVAARSNT
ncbi:MAG: threonine--tRNA ligase [Gammaproteobacteria bacterium]|nr:threonine--tRNA ligase [Gammaproteobacteria bacterium]